MSKYRKVDTRTLYDEKFRDLGDDGKLVFLSILIHPHMTALGAMRASFATLAEDLEWSTERFTKGFQEPLSKGMIRFDEKGRLVALPNFLKYNPADNPNVIKAWANSADLLPECDLKEEVISWAYDSLADRPQSMIDAFKKLFGKPLPKPSRNRLANKEQEKEQEQEPKQEQNSRSEGRKDTYTHAHARETDSDHPFDPPTSAEDGVAFLVSKGVPRQFMDQALHRLMRHALFQCDIDDWRQEAAGGVA
ncbi:hypothetical protein C7U61_14720 [Rhizobium sp. JAB6]|uniref:hypothetical protein n=1 Tax=Rhizobium sp. JAB6 TaxID=2127050 RepID=UPI000D12844D|nr:hypothetical protein [Rhizobium sp. JAB6]PST19740.1 hypothetical protein C7U61_14720 [Rhizobium sp. JAB6]